MRAALFVKEEDYAALERVLEEAFRRLPRRSTKGDAQARHLLAAWPIPRPEDWVSRVNRAEGKKELGGVATERAAWPAITVVNRGANRSSRASAWNQPYVPVAVPFSSQIPWQKTTDVVGWQMRGESV
jgi:hypothetical protein